MRAQPVVAQAGAELGVALGLLSGYMGGWLDRVLVMLADAIYAFPSLLLAIVMSIVISGGQSDAWGGILAAALYDPVFTTAITGAAPFVLALICFVLLIAWRAPAWAVVIVGAAGGILITLIG